MLVIKILTCFKKVDDGTILWLTSMQFLTTAGQGRKGLEVGKGPTLNFKMWFQVTFDSPPPPRPPLHSLTKWDPLTNLQSWPSFNKFGKLYFNPSPAGDRYTYYLLAFLLLADGTRIYQLRVFSYLDNWRLYQPFYQIFCFWVPNCSYVT